MMARTKRPPVTAHEMPTIPEVSTAEESTVTPSGSFSSNTTNLTCPNCHSSYPLMSLAQFNHHVAICSRPSTANDDDAQSVASSSSTPPHSPSLANLPLSIEFNVKRLGDTALPIPAPPFLPSIAGEDGQSQEESDGKAVEPLIRPYDLKSGFAYYDQMDVAEELEVEQPTPGLTAITSTASTPAAFEDANFNGFFETNGEASKDAEAGESSAENVETPDFIELPASPAKLDVPGKSQPATKIVGRKNPFSKLTSIEDFEKLLGNPREMEYEVLYAHTAAAGDALVAYQAEFDEIEKEINRHESAEKAELKRKEEENKEVAEKERVVDDAAREIIADLYREEVRYAPAEFQEWVAGFQDENPVDPDDTIRHLLNLRNPVFMAAVNKRKNAAKPEPKNVLEIPKLDYKITKEEIAYEKRKRGRLMDPVKFDDMKLADVYGFEYSSHARHAGNQPLPAGPRRAKTVDTVNGSKGAADGSNAPRTRGLRNKSKRQYEADMSAGGETEDDRPAKRVRKPKVFDDGEEASGSRSRSNAYSRAGSPAVRTFPSGKRVGRPPSKLVKVQVAPQSTPSNTFTNGNLNGGALPYGGEATGLSSAKETQLHNAAEALVKQVSDVPAATLPVKKKHAGGRPRKNPLPLPAESSGSAAAIPVGPKPKNKGGRPRKIPAASTINTEAAIQDMTVLQSTEQGDGSQEPVISNNERPKRKRTTTDSDQNQIIVDAPVGVVEPPNKKRRTRRGATEEQEQAHREPSGRRTAPPRRFTEEVEAPKPATRRARPSRSRGVTEERDRRERSTTAVATSSRSISVPKKRKASGAQRFSTVEPKDETDMDGDIDELNSDAKEVHKKKRVTKLKVAQVAQPSKATKTIKSEGGRLSSAPTARKTSNAVRNAMAEMDKEAAEAAAGMWTAPPPKLPSPPRFFEPTPAAEAKTRASPSKIKKEKPAPPPPARVSTRVRRPARLGFDGADDTDYEDDEGLDKQFASEYDHFQALTSPGGGQHLGKRVRKSLVDLSAFSYGSTDSDEVGDDFEEAEEDEIY